MMKLRPFLAAAAAAMLFSVGCNPIGEEPDFKGNISGTVYSAGAPLSGVNVVLSPGGNSFITKADGSYLFSALSPGQYTVSFSLQGYKGQTKTFNVTAGSTTTGDVSLEKDAEVLSADKAVLDFGTGTTSLSFVLTNKGAGSVSWSIDVSKKPDWLTVSKTSGSLQMNGTASISIEVDRSRVSLSSTTDSWTLGVSADTGQSISVKIEVTAGTPATLTTLLVKREPHELHIKCTPSENTSKYGVLLSKNSAFTQEQVIDGATYYTKETTVTGFNLDPDTRYTFYSITYNDFGQCAEMVKQNVQTAAEENGPAPKTVADFIGTWNMTAFDWEAKEEVTGSGLEISTITEDGEEWVQVSRWEGKEYFNAFGRFNADRQCIDLYSGYGSGSFHFTSAPDVNYRAYFFPVYVENEEDAYYIKDGKGPDNRAIASLVMAEDGSLSLTGAADKDSKGHYANAYMFEYDNLETGEEAGRFNVKTQVKMTRASATSAAHAAKPASAGSPGPARPAQVGTKLSTGQEAAILQAVEKN